MKFVFTLISTLFLINVYANPADSVRAEQREEGTFIVHEVEEEETLYSIAKRYGGSVIGIIKHNQIIDNRIEIGQTLFVLIKNEEPVQAVIIKKSPTNKNIHSVQHGETLYSISKLHDVKLKDLRKWNDLSSNDISPGMQLKLSKNALSVIPIDGLADVDSLEAMQVKSDSTADEPNDPLADFEKYLVQTGETLATIARKIGVSMDSLKFWNDLDSDFLKIGQQLVFKDEVESRDTSLSEPKKKIRTQIDEDGFEKIFEEGVASVIQSMNTSRFLALHRTLPIGTNLKVRNLMNNQVAYVKVVGKLPNTGLNKKLLLRLSQPAYDQLGILDSKSRVEVSYSKE
ncbi:LysM peptidoglycan-binding domain-containing protein [Ekhidna sp.]